MPASPDKNNDAPKTFRFLVRIWGAMAALCTISTGLFVLVTISAKCLVAAILQIAAGVLVFPFEAPIFCQGFDALTRLSDWVEIHFKFWMRATLYLGFALPPFFLCSELSTFVGCGSLVILAALYGVLAIGRKGSDVKKASSPSDDVEMKATLMTKTGEPNDLNTY